MQPAPSCYAQRNRHAGASPLTDQEGSARITALTTGARCVQLPPSLSSVTLFEVSRLQVLKVRHTLRLGACGLRGQTSRRCGGSRGRAG